MYLPFKELGYSQPEVERATVLNHRLDSWTRFPVTPTRRLGLSAFQRRFGLTARPPEADLVATTWLAGTPEPWTVEGHTAYDITHTVFHLTDWGENPDGLPPAIADYLAAWLPVWIDDWLDLERWDLLGELLVVDACLPPAHSRRARLQGFAAAQQPDGAMPAVRTMPEGDPRRCSTSSTTRRWSPPSPPLLATSRALTELAHTGSRRTAPRPGRATPPTTRTLHRSAHAPGPADESALRERLADAVDASDAPTSSSPSPGTAGVPCTPAAPPRPPPPREDLRYEIGSASKTFTGLLLTRLIRSGVLTGGEAAVACLDPARPAGPDPVTLAHLITHTSGLPALPADFVPRALPAWRTNYARYPAERLDRHLSAAPPQAPPRNPLALLELRRLRARTRRRRGHRHGLGGPAHRVRPAPARPERYGPARGGPQDRRHGSPQGRPQPRSRPSTRAASRRPGPSGPPRTTCSPSWRTTSTRPAHRPPRAARGTGAGAQARAGAPAHAHGGVVPAPHRRRADVLPQRRHPRPAGVPGLPARHRHGPGAVCRRFRARDPFIATAYAFLAEE